ncbi:hypothetical protein ACLOJK_028830 [Asimina triloba]
MSEMAIWPTVLPCLQPEGTPMCVPLLSTIVPLLMRLSWIAACSACCPSSSPLAFRLPSSLHVACRRFASLSTYLPPNTIRVICLLLPRRRFSEDPPPACDWTGWISPPAVGKSMVDMPSSKKMVMSPPLLPVTGSTPLGVVRRRSVLGETMFCRRGRGHRCWHRDGEDGGDASWDSSDLRMLAAAVVLSGSDWSIVAAVEDDRTAAMAAVVFEDSGASHSGAPTVHRARSLGINALSGSIPKELGQLQNIISL